MKVLIMGATSSVGMALKPLLSEFSEVITAGRKNCTITLDLDSPVENITLPNDLDVIIHTAAHFGGKTPKEMLEAENVNALGTLKLCNAAARAGTKHFIYISSIFSQLKDDSAFYTIYALSKKHSEELAKLFCSQNYLPLTILRPSQIYGNSNNFKIHHPFLYSMIDKAEKGEDIEIYGKNDAKRNFIHIDDLTLIITKAVQQKVEGIYSCAHPMNVSYLHIAKAAIAAFNSKSAIRLLKDKADIPDNIFDRDDSLYKKIEFYPQISIEDGMKKIAQYRYNLK